MGKHGKHGETRKVSAPRQTRGKNPPRYEKSLILSLFGDGWNYKTDVARLCAKFVPRSNFLLYQWWWVQAMRSKIYFNLMPNFHHCSLQSGRLFIRFQTCYKYFDLFPTIFKKSLKWHCPKNLQYYKCADIVRWKVFRKQLILSELFQFFRWM